jgi:membrane associated rhomboid family serine protease
VTDPLGGLSHQPEREPEPAPEPRTFVRPPRPTTWALLIVLGVAFAAEGLVGKDPSVESGVALFRLGALYMPAVRDGDLWRIGSYALLHIGWIHLLVNGYALWILAPQLEMTFGSNLTMGLFAATSIAGGAASAAWALHTGAAHLSAGASGGLFGMFGATVALYFRVRKSLPEPVRRSIMRAIALNLLINLAIAFKAPVDNAAHLGGLGSGILLGLVAPLLRGERQAWHGVARAGLLAAALALACMEGAAVARAVKPATRTLRGPGVEAQVPSLAVPISPGVAYLQGVVEVHLRREDEALHIAPGEDAVRIGDRTWLRQRTSENGVDSGVYAAADGRGTLVIEFACNNPVCRGAAGDAMVAQIARTARSTE